MGGWWVGVIGGEIRYVIIVHQKNQQIVLLYSFSNINYIKGCSLFHI